MKKLIYLLLTLICTGGSAAGLERNTINTSNLNANEILCTHYVAPSKLDIKSSVQSRNYNRRFFIPLPEALSVISNNPDSVPAYYVYADDETKTACIAFIGFPAWRNSDGSLDMIKNLVTLDSIIIPETIEFVDLEGSMATYTVNYIGGLKLSSSSHEISPLGYPARKYKIPNSVTKLFDNVFGSDCESPGSSAFVMMDDGRIYGYYSGNPSVEDITLPEEISIGEYAFTNCASLKNVNLPTTLKEIPKLWFYGCESLPTIEIPESVESIGEYAFGQCITLDSIVLPQKLSSIDLGTYANCTSLKKIEMPDFISYIEDEAFLNTALTSIIIPKGCERIGFTAFEGCNNVKYVALHSDMLADKNLHFGNSLIETVYFDCETVGHWFKGNSSLKKVELSDNVRTVSWGAFEGCTNLTSVSIPSNVENLWEGIFKGCVSLKDISLSENLQTLPTSIFEGCTSLETISLPRSLTRIANKALMNCSSLKELELPEGICSIGEYAFQGCTSLDSIQLPTMLNIIGKGLFSYCSNLRKIGLGDEVVSIEERAFEGCTKLMEVNIPLNLVYIEANAFYGCASLSEITFPLGLFKIGDYAFSECTNLSSIEFSNNIFEIGDYAFWGCNKLEDIKISAVIPPYAGNYTFPQCSYWNAKVTVPEQSLKLYTRENPWNRFRNYLTMNNGVSLSHYEVEMAGDEVFQLGVYNNKNDIAWSSSNPDVAYVNDCGLIVAMGQTGTTQIAANVDGETLNCRVLVTTPTRGEKLEMRKARRISGVTEIEDIDPVEIKIESIKGDPLMMNIRLNPVGACTVIDWRTSDDSLATIENGFVTIIGNGEVEFTVETENGLEDRMVADTGAISTGIDEVIFSENDNLTVYDLTGRCLFANGSFDQFKRLNKGIYIVNGKKVTIK